MKNVMELDEFMCRPSPALINDIGKIQGDIMVLGAGGKMGPTLCKLAANAIKEAGISKRVYAVSRFSNADHARDLTNNGVEVFHADLLNEDHLGRLPHIPNIIYMAGRKFGTSDDQSLTWVMNSYLPGRIADKFRHSRIVAFSTGNVYPFVDINSGGCREDSPTGPVGVYANTCLGRENVFKYFSKKYGTPVLMFRLNYAIDLRYGVLLEIAKAVYSEKPIDITTGYFNVVWQGYANEIAIRSILHCDSPPRILNVTGMETVSARKTAKRFAELFNKEVIFTGKEQETALLSNASYCSHLFGEPSVNLDEMIEMVADWVSNDMETLDKPTHFQEREGKF